MKAHQRKPYLVLGAGMMGGAIVYDLLHSTSKDSITVADSNLEKAGDLANFLKSKRVSVVRLDVQNYSDVVALMEQHTVAISAVPFRFNYDLVKAAIEAKTHFCDLGHNDEIVAKQLSEKTNAIEADICAIANCGLAPGLANILAMYAHDQFEKVDSVNIRVGGLPQHPKPPLFYQSVFSLDGLLEEYTSPVKILRNGKIQHVEPMSEPEEISFPAPFGSLEAFHTAGGTSRIPELLQGKVRAVEYKTIRFKGHCAKMKALLEVGFADDEVLSLGNQVITIREVFLELLKKRLTFNDTDVVLLSVLVAGTRNRERTKLRYRMIERYDEQTKMTAMMRTTAFPASIIAQMLEDGSMEERGVFTAEEVVPGDAMLEEVRKRGFVIEEKYL
ncbi:MAG: saccharopine dehydrogenase NADP-binding domain-containing protein [Bacteroidota bacterium]|nr:saccharopine dehydrogenase NADP-binding domain-containing protein [Bacteroidota bacterium]